MNEFKHKPHREHYSQSGRVYNKHQSFSQFLSQEKDIKSISVHIGQQLHCLKFASIEDQDQPQFDFKSETESRSRSTCCFK